jgi:hypothetical protein
VRFERSADCWRTTVAKKRNRTAFRTKAEREAWDAHVDETIATMRWLFQKEWDELQRKRRAAA